MFKVGDKVVCPMRGCGIVETIEDRKMSDQVQEYTVIKILNSSMTITLPTERLSNSRFRLISDPATMEDALKMLSEKVTLANDAISAKERLKTNTAKITSGSLKEYAEVVRDLSSVQKEKTLNAGERNVLLNARKFLVDEVSLIRNVPEDQVNVLINKKLA